MKTGVRPAILQSQLLVFPLNQSVRELQHCRPDPGSDLPRCFSISPDGKTGPRTRGHSDHCTLYKFCRPALESSELTKGFRQIVLRLNLFKITAIDPLSPSTCTASLPSVFSCSAASPIAFEGDGVSASEMLPIFRSRIFSAVEGGCTLPI